LVDLLEKHWTEETKDKEYRLEVIGKEKVTEFNYSKRYNKRIPKNRFPYKEYPLYEIDFVTETYHGGRNEQFWFGVGFEDVWNDFDLKSIG
tara:strand:+ start:117 stop:389 length:273 start_codon:yes stop_codon:yes gene_type:complete